MSIISIKASLGGVSRKSSVDLMGSKYKILPAIMILEGVYQPEVNSSDAGEELYFPAYELEKSLGSWDGRAVARNHPDGFTTFNSPNNYQKQWIGFIFNTEYDTLKKALKAELWVKEDRGEDIIEMVAQGRKVEVSIGAYGDIQLLGGESGGLKYTKMITNIVGDHLAILPDDKGACSWEHGCGVRAKKSYVAGLQETARNPTYEGTEDVSFVFGFKEYVDGYYSFSGESVPDDFSYTLSEITDVARAWICSKTLLGDTSTDSVDCLIYFPVVNPVTNRLNKRALDAVLKFSAGGAYPYDTDRTPEMILNAKKEASELLAKEFSTPKKETDMAQNVKKEVKTEDASVKACSKEAVAEVKEIVEKKVISASEYLEGAPEAIKAQLAEAMAHLKEIREGYSKSITTYSETLFCKKFIEAASTEVLKAISELVTKASEPKAHIVEAVKVEASAHREDFGLRAPVASKEKLAYAPIPKIDWAN